VLDGHVKVVRGSGSRQHVVHTERAGGTLGEVPVFAVTTHPATGIAAEMTRVAVFDRASLLAANAECPEIGFLINRRLALRVKALVNRLDERSRGMRARIAEYLLERAKTARRSQLISLGMTQHALAEELATVREVVSREMRALVRAGVIAQRGGGRYELLNLEELRRRAEEAR
jgi:CRP-like cAMP-binding protein